MHINIKVQAGILKKQNGYNCPQCLCVQDFDEGTEVHLSQALNAMNNSAQPVIPCKVDSFGGSIFSLLGILDILEGNAKPIMTYTTTQAMSCGAVLLAAGTRGYRYASKNATILIHEAASSFEGKKSDVMNDANHMESLNDKLMEILAKHSNKPKSYFKGLIRKNNNADLYIDAKEALQIGLIDKIGIPILDMEILAKYTIRCK